MIAQLALELGRAGVNITDMALYPAADMSEGVVALWIAGAEAPPRAEQLVAELGFPVARRVNVRVRAGRVRRCAAALRGSPPADKSISHRAAIVGAMAPSRVRIAQLPRCGRHRSTLDAVRALGAIVQHADDEVLIRGCGLRNARAPARRDRRGQRRHADAAAARVAGLPAGSELHARRRRVDPPPPGRPDRRAAAAMGARSRPARAALPPSPCTAPR